MKIIITNNFSKNEKWHARDILKESDQEIESSSYASKKFKSIENRNNEEEKLYENMINELKV